MINRPAPMSRSHLINRPAPSHKMPPRPWNFHQLLAGPKANQSPRAIPPPHPLPPKMVGGQDASTRETPPANSTAQPRTPPPTHNQAAEMLLRQAPAIATRRAT